MKDDAPGSGDDHEIEAPEDEFIVEISDLDESSAGGSLPRASSQPTRPWFLTRRYRWPVTIATGAFIALAMLIILFSSTPLKLPFMQAPAAFTLKLEANPPWGQLYVDGKSVQPPSGAAYPQFTVTAGPHRLSWVAAPFLPRQCDIALPVGSGIDTCVHPYPPPDGPGDPRTYITFSANLSVLPAAQRSELLQATQTALASQQASEMLRTGELFALQAKNPALKHSSCTLLRTAVLCFATADQPLQARLSMRLDTAASPDIGCLPGTGACAENGQNCLLFCDAVVPDRPARVASRSLWQSLVTVGVYWQFVNLRGQVIEAEEPDTFIMGMQNEHLLQLNIGWDGKHWHVTVAGPDSSSNSIQPLCDAAYGDMYGVVFASTLSTTDMDYVRMTETDSGCLIQLTPQAGGPGQPPLAVAPHSVIYVLQRFGVLLAVNDSAHRLWPFLPVVDSSARQLARQLIARRQ